MPVRRLMHIVNRVSYSTGCSNSCMVAYFLLCASAFIWHVYIMQMLSVREPSVKALSLLGFSFRQSGVPLGSHTPCALCVCVYVCVCVYIFWMCVCVCVCTCVRVWGGGGERARVCVRVCIVKCVFVVVHRIACPYLAPPAPNLQAFPCRKISNLCGKSQCNTARCLNTAGRLVRLALALFSLRSSV